MDESAVEFVKEHYNRKADTSITREKALERRRQGPALPLKQYHSFIKDKLLKRCELKKCGQYGGVGGTRFCYGVDKVLDFCCGRGGDIRKWQFAKIGYCKGIDLSAEEIEEARKRYDDFKSTFKGDKTVEVEFECLDILGKDIYNDSYAPYDAVTCFFALHYFMVSEDALENLFLNVSKNLKKGGYFVCTCPDGKRVLAALMDSKESGRLDTAMIKLVQKWTGKYECFGSAFICEITDTVTEGNQEIHGSYEYLVFTTPLKHIAAKYGLKLVLDYEDSQLNSTFCQRSLKEDKTSGFKHFAPKFPESDSSLELASSLNMAFVFQKVVERADETEFLTLPDLEKFPVTLPQRSIKPSNPGFKRKQYRDHSNPDAKKPRSDF